MSNFSNFIRVRLDGARIRREAARSLWVEEDDEIEHAMLEQQAHQSTTPRHRKYVNRSREEGGERLYKDYFAPNPVYDDEAFRRRYRMSRRVFRRIELGLENHTPYFQQRVDAAKKMGFTTIQKVTVALRMLAYGEAADRQDEYCRIGETTVLEVMEKFCRAIIEVFGAEYLRRPNADDVKRLFQMHERTHGFPGMLGSLDCMHWTWKNCPVGWKGQFTRGDHKVPTIMLEAVASQDLWIWHAYFGTAGANNDLNVLGRSTLFCEKFDGLAPPEVFMVNGKTYRMGYYLTDAIYPEWAAFVKSIPHAVEPKKALFKQRHEFARKDVERAFGVLQARFAIIRGPARFWDMYKLHDIMDACIILHNMIVEDERDKYIRSYPSEAYEPPSVENVGTGPHVGIEVAFNFSNCLENEARIRSRQDHFKLKQDLVEHIWNNNPLQDLNVGPSS